MPSDYICEGCKKHQSKQKNRNKKVKKPCLSPKEHSLQGHKKIIAPIDLLLSAAENASIDDHLNNESGNLMGESLQKVAKEPKRKFSQPGLSSEGVIKKAILKEDYIYLTGQSQTEVLDESSIKLKYNHRDLVSSLLAGYMIKNSKYCCN